MRDRHLSKAFFLIPKDLLAKKLLRAAICGFLPFGSLAAHWQSGTAADAALKAQIMQEFGEIFGLCLNKERLVILIRALCILNP